MDRRVQYTTANLAQIAGAELCGSGDVKIAYLLHDSRSFVYPSKSLFFAIQTASNNGHRYIGELYRKGVRAFVVDASFGDSPFFDADFLIAENVVDALQKIAAHHREQFKYPVVGITGSNGKTVVKEWLFRLLHKQKQVVRSPRSFNSQIGVPLSLWQMAAHHDVAVIEAGISMPGEMEKLAEMIRPTVGIFTNIGSAHAQNFDSIEQKAADKALLFQTCEKIIFNRDDALVTRTLQEAVQGDESRLLGWSLRGAKNAIHATKSNGALAINLYGHQFDIPLPSSDRATVENVLNAFLMAWHLGIPVPVLQQEAKNLAPVSMRLQERTGLNGNLLINDFYNSDPESVRVALDLLAKHKKHRRRILVLSDFEGIGSEDVGGAYGEIAEQIERREIDLLIGIGKQCARELQHLSMPTEFYDTTGSFLESGHIQKWHDAAILLKGARRFRFEKIAEALQEKVHQTWLEVHLNALVHNLRYYRKKIQPEVKLMAMVKAFGYGVGNLEVARLLAYNNVDYLAVAYPDEGIELRKGGIELPIMVMNPDQPAYRRMIEFDLEPEIYSIKQFREFNMAVQKHFDGERYPIHLKLETGMNRLGFSEDELRVLLAELNENQQIKVVSVFSHLAASDMPEHDVFSKKQIDQFAKMAAMVEQALKYDVIKHIANTSAIARFKNAQFDMVRLGIGLYGQANSEAENEQLQTVTRWLTRISQIKEIQAGESVGYGRSYQAEKKTRIATLPVGYADGYYRALSNGIGYVSIGGVFAPVVGRVCMDMIMVDVTGLEVHEGDEVELMGEKISAQDLAKAIETIPYEILTHISSRVPRVYLTE